MNKYDLEHKLQKGSVLYLDDIPTYKITLGELADHGFTEMQHAVSILCMEDSKAKEFLADAVENPSAFLLIALNILQEDSISSYITAFLSLFFKKPVAFHIDYGFLIGNEGETPQILNHLNYDRFREILKARNCLTDLDQMESSENPDNEMARRLLEKRRKLREKLEHIKRENGEDGLTMADLVSIFAQSQHMPLQEVYEKYDMYQFNNQFNRLRIIRDFGVNMQALLAGAKSEDIKLQHWLSKIQNRDN